MVRVLAFGIAISLCVLSAGATTASVSTLDVAGVGSGGARVKVVPVNPAKEGTFAWWEWNVAHNVSVPANATFTETRECMCTCHVTKPGSPKPFDCGCDCPAPKAGDRGVTGAGGEDGPPGPAAPAGPPGIPGDRGIDGPVGPQGSPGPHGKRGPRGTAGRHGRNGRSIPGPEGPPGKDGSLAFGPAGPRGPPGQRGFKGPVGDRGKSVVGNAGMHGVNGNPGPKGFRGKVGPQGPMGERGVDGPRGPTGPPTASFQTNNILGQVTAQGMCVGRGGDDAAGYRSAVLRDCSGGQSCKEVCASVTLDGMVTAKGSCVDSMSVYGSRSTGADDKDATGLVTGWYESCSVTTCGPNYCCCGFGRRPE